MVTMVETIQLGAVMDVDGHRAVRRQMLLDQPEEFPGQQMEGDIAAVKGVAQDQVIGLLVAIEKDAAVAVEIAHALAFLDAEIFLGRGDDAGIDLDGVDR